jgi:hypothetical protein
VVLEGKAVFNERGAPVPPCNFLSYRISGFGFRVKGFQISGSGFRVSSFGFLDFEGRVSSLGFRVSGSDWPGVEGQKRIF